MILRFQTRMLYNHNQNIKKGYLKYPFYNNYNKKIMNAYIVLLYLVVIQNLMKNLKMKMNNQNF